MQPDARASLEEQIEEEGKLWKQNPQRLREVLAEGSARARLPSITPHVLRHTFGERTLISVWVRYSINVTLNGCWIIAQFPRTKTYIVTRWRTSTRPMLSSLAG
jgi:integrase